MRKAHAAPSRVPISKGQFMAHKFSAGQRVSVLRGSGFGTPPGMVRIVGAMPREGSAPQQYRVRKDGEQFDRIVEEERLESVSYAD
jgi:hypothetical protein